MKYYKTIENGVIVDFGRGGSIHETQVEITKSEYDSLIETFENAPENTFESVYYLAESGVYMPRERTEEEKITWFVQVVMIGTVSIDDVPEEYRETVKAKLPELKYTLDEASEIIAKEVSGYVG